MPLMTQSPMNPVVAGRLWTVAVEFGLTEGVVVGSLLDLNLAWR